MSLTLPERLDAGAAADLRDAFLAHQGDALIVDASQVRVMSGQCLQVLIAAQNKWACDDLAFSYSDPSPFFCETARIVGLEAMI
ncbi:MAG: STAS domain-containing protein [Pseudomonadota bacterium]